MPTAQARQHVAPITEEPEAKKAGGVYYTPAYIVDYIIRQTIGKAVAGKTPAAVSKLKIVDPSCGSGNFLTGAYQFLLNWHRDYYNNRQLSQDEKKLLSSAGNLSTPEKKRILLNNIYGVDLDANAVEEAKRLLALICMEEEQGSSIPTADNSLLSLLGNNIRTGNSLLDTDFYDSNTIEDIDNIKTFNWQKEFPEAFSNGGFDMVIGNPPYGAALSKEIQSYCLQKFGTGNTDTAALFMIQAKQILKPQGYTGYIIPKSFTYASNWQKTRKELLPGILLLADCANVWKGVRLEMSIYIGQKGLDANRFITAVRKGKEIIETGTIDKSLCDKFDFILNGVTDQEIRAGVKLFNSPKRLNDFFINKRGATLQPHIHTNGDYQVIGGKQVQRYFLNIDVARKIKSSAITEETAFIQNDSLLVQNIVAHIQKPVPHIQITAAMPGSNTANECVILDTVNQLTNRTNLSLAYLLGVINSGPVSWYTCKFVFANAMRTMHFDNSTTARIPFPDIDITDKQHKANYDTIIQAVEQIIALQKRPGEFGSADLIKDKISSLQQQIDLAVCELFCLNGAPIAIGIRDL